MGSTSLTASSTGSKVAELCYHPWGGTRFSSGTTPTARRYTGQIEDAAIGLYFYNARYYDGALGRFIQADTIVPSPANPQSLNRYAYVLNNPLKYTDPTGHRPCGEYCDPSEMGLTTTENETTQSPVFADLQPKTNTGLGELVDFLAEPWLTPGFPRFEVKAWSDPIYHGRISFWGLDLELEFGRSLSGRIGSAGPWLVKGETLRWYPTKDGNYWVSVGPNEIASSWRFASDPRNEMRAVSAVRSDARVLQTSVTTEWTGFQSIPGAQTRGTTYLRIATNTYHSRYTSALSSLVALATGGEVLIPIIQKAIQSGGVPAPAVPSGHFERVSLCLVKILKKHAN